MHVHKHSTSTKILGSHKKVKTYPLWSNNLYYGNKLSHTNKTIITVTIINCVCILYITVYLSISSRLMLIPACKQTVNIRTASVRTKTIQQRLPRVCLWNGAESEQLPSDVSLQKGLSSSAKFRLFLRDTVSASGLLKTATIGTKESWVNSCTDWTHWAMSGQTKKKILLHNNLRRTFSFPAPKTWQN